MNIDVVAKVYNHPDLPGILECYQADRTGKVAHQLFETMVGGIAHMSRFECRDMLNSIYLTESLWSDIFGKAAQFLRGTWQKAYDFLKGNSPARFLEKVTRELPDLQRQADKIAAENRIVIQRIDTEVALKKLLKQLPQPGHPLPDAVVRNLQGIMEAQVDKSQSVFIGSDKFSVTYWMDTWILVYVFYGIVIMLLSGINAFGLGIVHVPMLVLMIVDLVGQLNSKKLVVP